MRVMHVHIQKSITELCEYDTFNILQIKSLSKEKKKKKISVTEWIFKIFP